MPEVVIDFGDGVRLLPPYVLVANPKQYLLGGYLVHDRRDDIMRRLAEVNFS